MTKKRNRIISAILTLTIAFGLFTWAYPMSAEETTLTDAEIQELIERSKLDKGDKYDDNIFTFEIQNLESINATLKAAAEADKLSLTRTSSAFDAAVSALETSGLSVQVSIDSTQLTRGESVTLITSTMSERNTDLSLPYSVLSETVGYARVANAANNHIYTSLKPNVVYTAELTVENTKDGKNENKTYVANYGIGFNEDGTLYCESTVIDVTDIISDAKAYFAQPLKVDGYNEPLNRISDNATVYTDIEAGEEKYFVFTATESGFVDTVLYSKEATDAKITVRKLYSAETYEEISARPEYTSAGSRYSDTVFTRFYANEGESYPVTIEGGNNSGAVVLSSGSNQNPPWFPQWNECVDGTIFWDAEDLVDVQIKYGTTTKDFYQECDADDTNYSWIADGCNLCCAAMILNRMGKMSDDNLYDARDSNPNNAISRSPDPYTVTMVNAGLTALPIGVTPVNADPMFAYPDTIADEFNASTTKIKQTNSTQDFTLSIPTTIASGDETLLDTQYAYILGELTRLVSSYPNGVVLIARTTDAEGESHKHYIVVSNVNGYLRVFDPGRNGSAYRAYRYNVPFYTYFYTLNDRDYGHNARPLKYPNKGINDYNIADFGGNTIRAYY